ncbi:MAG: PAS domain S-box protein [Pseudomonadota bacterium]
MPASLSLWCCAYLRREIEAVLATEPSLSGLNVEIYAPTCFLNPRGAQESLVALAAEIAQKRGAVVGGGCLHDLRPAVDDNLAVLAPQQCFYLVAPAALVDSFIADGAYVLTPGWLADWRRRLSAWGFDQHTAREFFRETTTKLVLLDTGVYGDCRAELDAMAAYLDLPFQVLPIGLDMLRLQVAHLIRSPALEAHQEEPSQRQLTDHLMLLELLSDLLTAGDEAEALERMSGTFHLLFAPGSLRFLPAGSREEAAALAQDLEYAWTASGRGFVLRLSNRGEQIGALEVDELALADYKERYLSLALPLAKVCALAIVIARLREKREKAEQAIRRIASIVESSEDAIIAMTLEGVIVSWNQGAQHLCGYSPEEVLGKHISILDPPDEPDEVPRMLEKIRHGEPTEQIEAMWRTKDGRQLDVSLQVSPIRDDNGRVVGASSIARDITRDKQRVQEERRSLEAQLMQAQKLESVGRLAGGVAHDFNNMLAVIMGCAEIALMEAEPDAPALKDLQQIKAAAERAKGLTRQLLAFARKQVLQMAPLNLNVVVGDFGKMIRRLIGEDIELKIALAETLPQVSADPSMIEQVLLNLAVNARDAMPDGGTLTIETRLMALDETYAMTKFEVSPGDYVMLAVSDTGTGMDEATRQMLFEPFFTTKAAGMGTGLGLATVYGIVKQHGGSIWVYSEPGQGTTFKVYLPVSQQAEAVERRTAEAAPRPSGGETILVVEDEDNLRQVLCVALGRLGYLPLCANGAEEAMALAGLHQGPIQLLLTDVVMPGLNGRELFEALAPTRPDLKVLYMSGYTENIIAHRGVLEEGINFIQKPFSMPQLTARINAILFGAPEPPQA